MGRLREEELAVLLALHDELESVRSRLRREIERLGPPRAAARAGAPRVRVFAVAGDPLEIPTLAGVRGSYDPPPAAAPRRRGRRLGGARG